MDEPFAHNQTSKVQHELSCDTDQLFILGSNLIDPPPSQEGLAPLCPPPLPSNNFTKCRVEQGAFEAAATKEGL